jgi:hypothetical protein
MKYLVLLLTMLAGYEVVAGSNEPIVSFLIGTPIEGVLNRLHNGNAIMFRE